jgi:hypothetical protein
MSGSYTAFEVEAERRQELIESALREVLQRRSLEQSGSQPRRTDESTQGHGLAEAAASLVNRVSQRA